MAEGGDELVERIAAQVGDGARASAVFGKPVERKGVTVIPVARARWAFGGGSGSDPRGGAGGGGGGMATVRPVGYIEVRNGGATYKPLRDWPRIGLTVTASVAVAGAVAFGLSRR